MENVVNLKPRAGSSFSYGWRVVWDNFISLFLAGLIVFIAGAPFMMFVNLDDISGELRLCKALMQNSLNWSDPWAPLRDRLIKNTNKYNKLL